MPNIHMLHIFLAVIIVIALFYLKISGATLDRPKKIICFFIYPR